MRGSNRSKEANGMGWIAASCASALFAGLVSILSKLGVRTTDPDVATAVRTSVVAVAAWCIAALSGSLPSIPDISPALAVSGPIGPCDGRLVDMLFQGAVPGRR